MCLHSVGPPRGARPATPNGTKHICHINVKVVLQASTGSCAHRQIKTRTSPGVVGCNLRSPHCRGDGPFDKPRYAGVGHARATRKARGEAPPSDTGRPAGVRGRRPRSAAKRSCARRRADELRVVGAGYAPVGAEEGMGRQAAHRPAMHRTGHCHRHCLRARCVRDALLGKVAISCLRRVHSGILIRSQAPWPHTQTAQSEAWIGATRCTPCQGRGRRAA